MPNIKSAIKRVKVTEVKRLKNQMRKSALKTYVKNFDSAVVNGDKNAAEVAFKVAVKKIDQAVCKNILHKNTAARKKSKLAVKLNALNA